MPGINKSEEAKFFEYFYYSIGIHVMNNILQIDELCEKSFMFIPASALLDDGDELDENSGGSIEIKLADLDKDQYNHFVSKFLDFANHEGTCLISDVETFSIIQEINVEFKPNFEENLKKCVKQSWGKINNEHCFDVFYF